MTAEEHNKTLATLYFIYGAIHGLTLLGLLLLVFVFKFASAAGELLTPFWMTVGGVVFVVLLFAVGLLPLLVAYSFKERKRWAKSLALPLAIISLVNIPVGTALGIYTIKFFRSEGGTSLYGGKTGTASEGELQDALRGAKPLMNLAERFK